MKHIAILILIFSFIFSGCSEKKHKAVRKSLMMPKKSEIVGNEIFKKKERKIEKMRKKRMKKKR
jgi:ABC-type uncharacterized transport system auxiliary subunit